MKVTFELDEIVETLNKLSNSIRDEIAKQTLSADFLAILAKDPYWHVRYTVTCNDKTTTQVLDLLSKDPYSEIRSAVAAHRNTSIQTLATLAKDNHHCNVRCSVAKNPKSTAEILAILANDPSLKVQQLVARHPNYKSHL